MKEKILKDYDNLVNEWKEPEFVFERHSALIDYTSNLIKKSRELISQALDEYGAEKYEKGYLDGKNNQPKGLNK